MMSSTPYDLAIELRSIAETLGQMHQTAWIKAEWLVASWDEDSEPGEDCWFMNRDVEFFLVTSQDAAICESEGDQVNLNDLPDLRNCAERLTRIMDCLPQTDAAMHGYFNSERHAGLAALMRAVCLHGEEYFTRQYPSSSCFSQHVWFAERLWVNSLPAALAVLAMSVADRIGDSPRMSVDLTDPMERIWEFRSSLQSATELNGSLAFVMRIVASCDQRTLCIASLAKEFGENELMLNQAVFRLTRLGWPVRHSANDAAVIEYEQSALTVQQLEWLEANPPPSPMPISNTPPLVPKPRSKNTPDNSWPDLKGFAVWLLSRIRGSR